jgi:protein-disulfide isomerase
MGAKSWIIFSVVVVALLGGLVYFSNQSKLDVSKFDAANVITANENNGNIGDHVFGNGKAGITLIEYGDFQCNPGCRLFHENFSPIMEDEHYKDNITFVFRNFPISQIHPNAMAAAAAAEAAGMQGKYWEMWDTLFTNQSKWSGASSSERGAFFDSYAKQIGLDMGKFATDSSSDAVSAKLRFDRAIAASVKVSGTPTVFLNGKLVDGKDIQSTETIKALLDQAIEKK